MLPTTFEDNTISTFFNLQSTPTNNWWSGIAVKGWSGEYGVWMLAGPAAGDNAGNRLYYKDGNHSNWATDWKGLAFLDDINNVATSYFAGETHYVDYGWWVIGLCKIGPADSNCNYSSGTMFYKRGNGIYGNGSVSFNFMKQYNTTKCYVGIMYNGYGISTDEDAPKLCTFTYQGVEYAGLCWTSAASLDSFKTLMYENSTNGIPFYVKFYNSQSGEVFDSEIKNSIVYENYNRFILYNNSSPCGFFTYANKGIEIVAKDSGWAFSRYRTNNRYYDIGLSGTTAGMNGTGNFEIRSNGDDNDGIFVRYGSSTYGKLGVVSKNTNECSISYYNSVSGSTYPTWTVGIGMRDKYSFDWWYYNQGYKMTLNQEGKLFVNVKGQNSPTISLAIGDNDTGLNWQEDGQINFMSNGKTTGHWNYLNGRLYNVYFREPTGNGYAATAMMVNGNGSDLYPGVGFHQPGVTAGVVYFTSAGEFKFRNITDTGYTNVYGGNLIADAGYLYSRYNGIEIKIGSENSSYVHFITNPARSLYFQNSLFVNGGVHPYVTDVNDIGDAGHVWRYIYANKLLGGANWSDYLSTHYVGGQQANPQTYFTQQTGLKVAMTGVNPDSYWGDTLWINGYYGNDVLPMCALHFSRSGSPYIYISAQNSTATSYGTMYHIWTGFNSNHSSASWNCSTLNASGRIATTSDILSSGWIRALGTNGFYCESYGGGWHMTDSTWIRAYNNKQIYTASTSPDAIHTLGGINASGRIYSGSYVELHGGLVCAGVGNSGGASGFNVYGSFYGNASHGGIEIGASDNVLGIGVHSNDSWYIWWTNSGSIGSSSNKSYIFSYNGSSWNFTGSVVASGEVTAYSDARLKSNIHTLDYRGRLIPRHYVKDSKQSIGFIAQEVQALYPELVLGQDKNRPYLSLNYNGCTAVLSAQLNHVEDEVTILKNKVRELEIKVSVLTEQLHSQAI